MIIMKELIIGIIFKITTTTSIIITDRYSKLVRSSYRYCFPHCSHFEKKMLYNSVFVRVDVVCCF